MAESIEESLSFLLIHASRLHRNRVGAGLEALGLHVGQELLLKRLEREDGRTQSELAELLGVEPPTVTKMLSRMEATGMVERRKDPADARVSRVYLTEQGRAVLAGVDRVWAEEDARMFAGFSLEERLLMRRWLMQIRKNLG